MAAAARQRVLAEHTAGHRAEALEAGLRQAIGQLGPARRMPALEIGA
jgi:hypothetical protein